MNRIRKFDDIKWGPFDVVDRTLRDRAKTDVDCAAQVAKAEASWREQRARIDAEIARREAKKSVAERERENAEAVQQGQRIVNRLQDALGRQGITDRIEDWPSLKGACQKYWRKIGRPAADFRRVGPHTILWIAETQNRLPRSVYAQHRPLSLNMGPAALLGTDYREVMLIRIRWIDYDGRALVTPGMARHDLVKQRAEANRERIGADRLSELGLRYNPGAQITTYELTKEYEEIIDQEARKFNWRLSGANGDAGRDYDADDFRQDGYFVVRELLIAQEGKPIDLALVRYALAKSFSDKLTELVHKRPNELPPSAWREDNGGDSKEGSDKIEYRALAQNADRSWARDGCASPDPEGLTSDQNAIAGLWMTNPELSEAEIGDELGLSQSTVSRAKKTLIKQANRVAS
jgi:hypothetical protein